MFLRITGQILSVLVIFFLSISILGQLFFSERLIDVVGFRVFIIGDTGSMMPVLQYRDLVVIRRFDFNDLEIGDYVTFQSRIDLDGEERNIFVTHEIVDVEMDSKFGSLAYRTSGIHPDVGVDRRFMTIDGSSNTNKFLGKYLFRIRMPQEIHVFLMSVPGIISIIVNFICTILIGLLVMEDELLVS